MELLLTRRILPFEERRSARPLEIDSLISKLPFLPPAFELIPRLLLLLDDPNRNCEEVAEVIRIDPNLTADVLQIANSASAGGRQRTDSLANAIIRVGLRDIYRVVTQIVTSPVFTAQQDTFAAHKIDLWRHALSTAVGSQVLARETGEIDPEVAFTAGLLHDIGKVILAHAAGEEYFHLLAAAADNQTSALQAEQTSFRLTHTEAAGRLLRAWHFPPLIIEGVVHHHDPFHARQHGLIAAVVFFGNIISHRLGHGYGFPPYAVDPDPDALQLLKLEPSYLKNLEEQVLELFNREQSRFQ